MKKAVKRIFVELYYWQKENWGKDGTPALGALLYLSILQFFNIGCILIAVQNIFNIKIFSFLGVHYYVGLIIPISILVIDYLIVSPISLTIEQNPLQKPRITWIYVLFTLLVLGGCIAWIVYNNEH